MSFLSPSIMTITPRGTSLLSWKDKDTNNELGGEYYIRGSLCWPGAGPQRNNIESMKGVAYVFGKRVDIPNDERVFVLNECEFLSIDHIVDENNGITYKGASSWFNNAFSYYYCNTFYYNCPPYTHNQYYLQVKRSPLLKPIPSFLKLDWEDASVSESLVWRMKEQDLLIRNEGSIAERSIDLYLLHDRAITPGMWALMCGLWGMSIYKYKPRTKNTPEYIVI